MSTNYNIDEKQALFLAGQPAVDFLNTEWPNADGKKDFFNTDDDVFLWLRQAKLAIEGVFEVRPMGSLLRAAHALRDTIRYLVEERKAGKQPDLSDLNAFLAAAQRHRRLTWTKAKTVTEELIRSHDTAEQILAPLAEKAADLLVHVDFRRIRRCADPICMHWFYDTTKSGRRRWCSMATCGNKVKVKAYRMRKNVD